MNGRSTNTKRLLSIKEILKKKQAMVMVKISIISASLTEMDERLDYAYKSQPIREHDCTVCMTCQEICPEGSSNPY